ncbi:MAG: hypothetical protein ACI9S6_001348 [Reinekea sp.]|jgi:hypothetical protein
MVSLDITLALTLIIITLATVVAQNRTFDTKNLTAPVAKTSLYAKSL